MFLYEIYMKAFDFIPFIDESLNTACSPGTSGRDIVGSDAGSGSGATREAKFAKRATSKNNYHEAGFTLGCCHGDPITIIYGGMKSSGLESKLIAIVTRQKIKWRLYETYGLQTINAKAQHHRAKQNLTQYGIRYDLLTMTRHAFEGNKKHVKTV
uniref:Uncharacterized protein n=1 Tax=Glossina austeni TaxID=7395 RepID=A0A1A9UHV3_GLOAU